MAEWPIALVLKTSEAQASGGSIPTLSARSLTTPGYLYTQGNTMQRPFTFWLGDEDKETLRRRAFEQDCSISEVIRQALDQFLHSSEPAQQKEQAEAS